jgi:hypothetical protein
MLSSDFAQLPLKNEALDHMLGPHEDGLGAALQQAQAFAVQLAVHSAIAQDEEAGGHFTAGRPLADGCLT